MKDSKTKSEESTRITYTGLSHSCCHTYLETSVSQRQATSAGLCTGCVGRSDAPVYMRERGGGRRGSYALRNAISTVIHTQIRQFHRGRQHLPVCVVRWYTRIFDKRIVLRSDRRNRKPSFIPFCFSSKPSSNRHVRTRRQGVHPQDRHLV